MGRNKSISPQLGSIPAGPSTQASATANTLQQGDGSKMTIAKSAKRRQPLADVQNGIANTPGHHAAGRKRRTVSMPTEDSKKSSGVRDNVCASDALGEALAPAAATAGTSPDAVNALPSCSSLLDLFTGCHGGDSKRTKLLSGSTCSTKKGHSCPQSGKKEGDRYECDECDDDGDDDEEEEEGVTFTTTKDNQSLLGISKRLGVGVDVLVALNQPRLPTLQRRSRLYPGTELRLPSRFLELQRQRQREQREQGQMTASTAAAAAVSEVADSPEAADVFCSLSLFLSDQFQRERMERRGPVRARLVF